MTPYPFDREGLRDESGRPRRLFYELYPSRGGDPEGAASSWFEIALHAEIEGPHPPDHPESQEVLGALLHLAATLLHNARVTSDDGFDLSHSYYTLHSPDGKDSDCPQITRTLSLVFANTRPRPESGEAALLEQITNQLCLLHVSRL